MGPEKRQLPVPTWRRRPVRARVLRRQHDAICPVQHGEQEMLPRWQGQTGQSIVLNNYKSFFSKKMINFWLITNESSISTTCKLVYIINQSHLFSDSNLSGRFQYWIGFSSLFSWLNLRLHISTNLDQFPAPMWTGRNKTNSGSHDPPLVKYNLI